MKTEQYEDSLFPRVSGGHRLKTHHSGRPTLGRKTISSDSVPANSCGSLNVTFAENIFNAAKKSPGWLWVFVCRVWRTGVGDSRRFRENTVAELTIASNHFSNRPEEQDEDSFQSDDFNAQQWKQVAMRCQSLSHSGLGEFARLIH